MKNTFFFAFLALTTTSSYAQSSLLKEQVQKLGQNRDETEFKNAVSLLNREAKLVELEIQMLFNEINLRQRLVKNVIEYIERSEEKAEALKKLNDKAESIISLAETFIAPISEEKIRQMLTMMENDSNRVRELKLPEYPNTAFNAELKRTAPIRAKLFYYY